VSDPRRPRWKVALGIVASVAIAGLAAWVLWRTFQRISIADVLHSMRETSPHVLLLASLCVIGAYLALGLYEIAAVRYVKHSLGRSRPMLTALIAFPVGHAIGQAVLSGGAIRYRMYTPAGFSATEVGATVLMAGLPYVLGFGLLFDLALIFGAERLAPLFRISSGWLLGLGLLGLAKDLGYVLFVRLRKAPIRLGGWAVPMPSPAMTALQFAVGIADVVLVSGALYLLLPDSAQIAFLPFIAVYLASVLAGVLSHVPAGLGVLESMLLLLMPHVPPADLLAAVLLYRVIYEVVPVLLALGIWGFFELGAADGIWRRLRRR
jgi:uncharacterized membrane protein YbhN (UPF0104 family)